MLRRTITARTFLLFLPVSAVILALAWSPVDAATTEPEADDSGAIFTPQITIPDSPFIAGTAVPVKGTTLGEWVSAVYMFLAGAMAIIATMMVMWGGIQWLTASGNAAHVNDAKETIYSAILALLLTFGSYLLLRTINPRLVEVRDLSELVTSVARIEQLRADLPKRVSAILFGDAGLSGDKNAFNAQACPTLDEMRDGIEVFLTGYYKPAYPGIISLNAPSGGYPNFACNVGMQCSCERNNDPAQLCRAGGLTWKPCDLAKEGLEKYERGDYCNKTASGSAPGEFLSQPAIHGCGEPGLFRVRHDLYPVAIRCPRAPRTGVQLTVDRERYRAGHPRPPSRPLYRYR